MDVYHAYYFQIQAQLKFSNALNRDFVVWSNNELVMQCVKLDEPFCTIQLERCKQFIKLAVLPEILGKWYSREPSLVCTDGVNDSGKEETWCYCGMGEFGERLNVRMTNVASSGFIWTVYSTLSLLLHMTKFTGNNRILLVHQPNYTLST